MKANEYLNTVATLLEAGFATSNYIELDASSMNGSISGRHSGQMHATIHQEYMFKFTHRLSRRYVLDVTLFEKNEMHNIEEFLDDSYFRFGEQDIPAFPLTDTKKNGIRSASQLKYVVDRFHENQAINCVKKYLFNGQKEGENGDESIGVLLKFDHEHILVGLRVFEQKFTIDAVVIPKNEMNRLDGFLQDFDLNQSYVTH